MIKRDKEHRSFPEERRGVGAIIGGVIIAAILLTTVLVYFITILNNEKAKTTYEILASQASQDKAAEKFNVPRAHELANVGGVFKIEIQVSNNGSLPLVVSKVLLYCTNSTGCPFVDPEDDVATPANGTINAAEVLPIQVGPVLDTLTYRIDVISERGNIVAAKECNVNVTDEVCDNDSPGGGEEPPCTTCPVIEGIIQGTGSVVLDYRAFGSVYPFFALRDGVAQRGWEVQSASTTGSVHGYPAFDIMSGAPVIFVERFRNFDPSGNNLTLARSTSLLTNIGKEPSNQPDIEYICKENFATSPPSMLGYDEVTNKKVLPATPLDALPTEGWTEVYFCSQTPGAASNDYIPRNTFNIFHPLFMVIRGTFSGSLADYGQTVPYQSTLGGATAYTSFDACLRDDSASPGPSTACVSPTTADATASLNYHATRANMISASGVKAWVHVNSATIPPSLLATKLTVSWMYPDGTFKILAQSQVVNSNKNVLITLPKVNSDGSPISCSAGTTQYYAVKVTDEFDSGGQRNVYYMTFRMDC